MQETGIVNSKLVERLTFNILRCGWDTIANGRYTIRACRRRLMVGARNLGGSIVLGMKDTNFGMEHGASFTRFFWCSWGVGHVDLDRIRRRAWELR